MNTVKLTKFLVSTSIAIAIPAMAGVPLTPVVGMCLLTFSLNFITTILERQYIQSLWYQKFKEHFNYEEVEKMNFANLAEKQEEFYKKMSKKYSSDHIKERSIVLYKKEEAASSQKDKLKYLSNLLPNKQDKQKIESFIKHCSFIEENKDDIYDNVSKIKNLANVIPFAFLRNQKNSIIISHIDMLGNILRSFAEDKQAFSALNMFARNFIGLPIYSFNSFSGYNFCAVFATSLYMNAAMSSANNLAEFLADNMIASKYHKQPEYDINDWLDYANNNIKMPFIAAVASCAFSSLGLYPIIAKIPFADKIMSEELLASMSR